MIDPQAWQQGEKLLKVHTNIKSLSTTQALKALTRPAEEHVDIKSHPWMEYAMQKFATTAPINRYIQSDVSAFFSSVNDENTQNIVNEWGDNGLNPWCSAFVNWCMMQANLSGTASASAQSWVKWGLNCDSPEWGCVTVVKWREKNGELHYHVGFYIEANPRNHDIYLLAGNQRLKEGQDTFSVNIRGWKPNAIVCYRIIRSKILRGI